MEIVKYAKQVLYLDFDGVLHPDDVYWYRNKGIVLQSPGHALFEHVDLLESLLEPYPELKIVLSTSWVRAEDFNFAKSRLSQSLQRRVIGATYHSAMKREYGLSGLSNGALHGYFAQLTRYQQIQGDLKRRAPHVWLALDDDTKGWPAEEEDNLVAPCCDKGLARPDVLLDLRRKLLRFA